jgi:hypothetical protein
VIALGLRILRHLTIISFVLTAIFSVSALELSSTDLYNSAVLVKNTPYCGGGTQCEAIFTIPSLDNKTLNLSDVLITFEDANGNQITPTFTFDFTIGTLQNYTQISTQWTNCTSTTESNGSINLACTPTNVSLTRQEIVYHGKYLVPGINYVRIWSNNKPGSLWIDWQVLLKEVPASSTNKKSLDFDTHQKGWAVWGVSPAASLYTGVDFHLNYNETSGSTVLDSLNQYNGTSGGTFVQNASGIIDRAHNTSGTSNAYKVNLSSHTSLPANFTMSFWIKWKTDSSDAGNVKVLTKLGNSTHSLQILHVNPADKIRFSYGGISWTDYDTASGYNLATQTWQNIILRRNGTNCTLFLNGSAINNVSCTPPTNSAGHPWVELWNDGGGSGTHNIDGYADHTTLWSRALSDTEIQQVWNGGSGIAYASPSANFTPKYQRQVIINWDSSSSAAPSAVTNKSISIIANNATFNNSANPDFGDVRIKMANSTNNDTTWDYKLTWLNATDANFTFTVSSDSNGVFNSVNGQQYFFVWGNNTGGATTSNSSLATNFTNAPTNWTFGSTSGYGEGGMPETPANESQARDAISSGLLSSVLGGSYTAYYDRQVYIRIANGSQYKGTFDVFVASGNKRWAFNYDNVTSSGFPSFANISNVLYVWQKANRTSTNITYDVSAFINSTN